MVDPHEPLLTDSHVAHLRDLCARLATWDADGLRLGEQYVMFHAESALMRRHAELLTADGRCDVLEIGGGLGVFALQVLGLGIRSYTAVEPHPSVAARLRTLVADSAGAAVTRVLQAPWQSMVDSFEPCDAIMYDTWPPHGMEDRDFELFVRRVGVPCLRPAGRFSFFASGDPSERRLRCLHQNFASVHVEHFDLGSMPKSWTKPTNVCTVCVCERPGEQ